jgi:hypothetical protein
MELVCIAVSEQFRKIQRQPKDFHSAPGIFHHAQGSFQIRPAHNERLTNGKLKTTRKDKK